MIFVTLAPLILHENPGLTVVRYGLANDEYGRMYLGSMESRYTGYDSFLELAGNPIGKPMPIVENTEEVLFEYYGFDPQLQIYQWYESWNTEETMVVPDAVRISYEGGHVTVPINATTLPGRRRGGYRSTRTFIPMNEP